MVYLLEFLEILEELVLVHLVIDVSQPAYREAVLLGLLETITLQCKLHQAGVTFNHLEQEASCKTTL